MKIILVESVNHLGRSGEVVAVKPGYARNFLIPRGFALVANRQNMKVLEERKAEISQKEAQNLKEAKALKAVLEAITFDIKAETNEDGALFGSVGVSEMAKLLSEKGHIINKRDIVFPEGAIVALGSFPVDIICHVDVTAKLTLNVS